MNTARKRCNSVVNKNSRLYQLSWKEILSVKVRDLCEMLQDNFSLQHQTLHVLNGLQQVTQKHHTLKLLLYYAAAYSSL